MEASSRCPFADNLRRAVMANDAVCRPRAVDYAALERATGIKRSTLMSYMRGRNKPSADNLARLAAGIGVSVDELVRGA